MMENKTQIGSAREMRHRFAFAIGVLVLASLACLSGILPGSEEATATLEPAAETESEPPTEAEVPQQVEEAPPPATGITAANAENVQLLREFQGSENVSFTMRLSPDASEVAVFGSDGVIRIMNVDTGAEERLLEGGHSGPGSALAYSPDGSRLVSGGEDFRLTLWDLESGDPLFNVVAQTNPGDAVFTPDGQRIVFIGFNNTPAFVYDLDGNEVGRVTEHGRVLGSVDVSPDGTLIASGNARGNVVVSDSDSQETVATLNDGTGTLWSTRFSPDGSRLAAASGSGDVWVWNTGTWALDQTWLAHSGGTRSLAWSSDGSVLVSGGAGGQMILWNPENGRDLNTFQLPGGAIWEVEFAPDGSFLATLSGDDAIVRVFGLP